MFLGSKKSSYRNFLSHACYVKIGYLYLSS